MLRYLVLQDIKYCIRLGFAWYLPGRTTTEQSYKFPVCAIVGVLFSLDILLQGCEKYIETHFSLLVSFSFGFGVLHSPVIFQCIECYLTKTEQGIRFQ